MPTDPLTYQTLNPYSGEVVKTYDLWDAAGVQSAFHKGRKAFEAWCVLPVEERAAFIRQLARLLRIDRDTFAGWITNEMGKPISQSHAEIDKCAWLCDHFADQALAMLAIREVTFEEKKAWLRPEPMGAILGIMPWNYPFWQVFRYAVPTILAGNVAFLKPAPNVIGCGEAIAFLFGEALPVPNVFQCMIIDESQVEGVISDPFVRGVAFTGSVSTGAIVGALAGKYRKKSVLELGGSDPFIVLSDADLDRAVAVAAQARLNNNGQTCIAAKRFLIEEEIYDAFLEKLVAELQNWTLGDPWDENTRLSTLARQDLKDHLLAQVEESVAQGARIHYNGNQRTNPAFGVAPLILTDIPEGSPAFAEELFGPVFSVFRVKGEDEAVELANQTVFGLSASVWTSDPERAMDIASRLDVGTVAFNQMVASDPRLPFGGTKDSGYGRELGKEGILEFVNLKTVVQ